MASIISSLTDLVQSVIEVIWSLFHTAFNVAQNGVSFVVSLFAGALNLVADFFKGIIELTGGMVQFIISKSPLLLGTYISQQNANGRTGNIIVLGVIVAVFVGFLQYQKNQGRAVKVGDKKLN